MSLLDLKCQKSVSSSKDCCYIDANKDYLRLGCDYQIYLSFQLPPFSCIKNLKTAKLILFKIPGQFFEKQISFLCNNYFIYPLLDFFSIYGCNFTPPRVSIEREETFNDEECCAYTEADITCIVKSWIAGEIENKGLLLQGNNDTRLITYASERYQVSGMYPILRLIYDEDSICQPLSVTPCTIEVDN